MRGSVSRGNEELSEKEKSGRNESERDRIEENEASRREWKINNKIVRTSSSPRLCLASIACSPPRLVAEFGDNKNNIKGRLDDDRGSFTFSAPVPSPLAWLQRPQTGGCTGVEVT